ncbi:hypothetical protein ABB37_03008 [Leptomonas pyrrhocoris]|uniref:C3H1-type domain-containing protein n=1 Tax=Leptomonas pyrrhocoris TaxID=157538 RepID=A0A0M9G680_LEPPY|nr:hypothetical protein ABB37_03008 [Leptomonas pyrrhocoris]KPA83360.1 hypothetical protein ABB37_03008 [Leptomonas pyrrhocoris]|eukprot:XP_015661799.1 hypothetical protein ABB37_03008 [Leptomonas pyrrhocoris]
MQQRRRASTTENQQYVTAHAEDEMFYTPMTLLEFAEFMDVCFPVARSLTVSDSIDMLSVFTSVPPDKVLAALQLEPSFAFANCVRGNAPFVSTTVVCFWLHRLMRPTNAAESWWDASDVYLHDASTEGGACNGRATDRPAPHTEDVRSVPLPARSGQPPRPASSSQRTGERSGREASMHPTRNSGSWRDVSDGRPSAATAEMERPTMTINMTTTHTTPVTSRQPSQGTAPSMEQVVAVALSEMDALADKNTQLDCRPVHDAQGTATRDTLCPCENVAMHKDRPRSPLPVQPPAQQQLPPLPPSTTLAELESYVHRGRKMKVCRQFMHTGTCSYGARCLFHHHRPWNVLHSK